VHAREPTVGVAGSSPPGLRCHQVTTSTVGELVTCGCGRPSKRLDGRCHPCYVREWKKARKTAGGPLRAPCTQDWFDWEVVCRAWAGLPTGRKLTRAEREYLASLICTEQWSEAEASRLLGMEPKPAAEIVRSVADGRIVVPARDWQGLAA